MPHATCMGTAAPKDQIGPCLRCCIFEEEEGGLGGGGGG